MSNEMIKFELREKDLELVVNEKTLGSLATNARQIKEMVEAALPNYDISNYNEDNIAFAKKDKAMLNAASKALNDKRIQFEKEFVQPFAEFKGIVADTVMLIKECSGKIDVVVKQSEENERTAKRAAVSALWEKKCFTLVPISKIFDEKWLNKSATLKSIEAEITAKIASINDDIITIEAIGEDADLLKSIYLDTLNVNSTIQYANKLKENKERARAEAEARATAEAARAEAKQRASEVVAAEPTPAHSPTEHTTVPQQSVPTATQQEPIMTRAFEISATKTQIIQLAKYMESQGITYNKIDMQGATNNAD